MIISSNNMALLRPFALWLRKRLTELHRYSVCCASCGEVRVPLGDRLCTSLAPFFSADAVLLTPGTIPAGNELTALREKLAWAATLWVQTPPGREECVQGRGLRGFSLDRGTALAPVEGLLHTLQGLAEHYLVLREPRACDPDSQPLDYFTPNGLPLLFYPLTSPPEPFPGQNPRRAPGHPALFGQTRANSRDFLEELERTPPKKALSGDEYLLSLAAWTFTQARAVPCGPAMLRSAIPLFPDHPGKGPRP